MTRSKTTTAKSYDDGQDDKSSTMLGLVLIAGPIFSGCLAFGTPTLFRWLESFF